MESRVVKRSTSVAMAMPVALAIAISGCTGNPFAPPLGDSAAGLWNDQHSVGGLLSNFVNSYLYRDSLRYSDCLAESFLFIYYDPESGRFDQWYRLTDLRTTGALFRTFDDIRLAFATVPSDVANFNLPDSVLSFQVAFNLEIGGQLPIFGYARFESRREDDGKFRLISWRDDF